MKLIIATLVADNEGKVIGEREWEIEAEDSWEIYDKVADIGRGASSNLSPEFRRFFAERFQDALPVNTEATR